MIDFSKAFDTINHALLMDKIAKLNPGMSRGGKFLPRPLFLLPFPNHMELRDAPSSRLFLNRIWLQDVAFRPYLSHSRNPIWRPENRKFFEINFKKDITTTNEIAPATPIFTTTPVSAMTLADTRNSKWRPPKSFSFQNSESGVVEMWG